MRIVLDILLPDSGSVTWQGRRNTELPRRTWGYLPEERGLAADGLAHGVDAQRDGPQPALREGGVEGVAAQDSYNFV